MLRSDILGWRPLRLLSLMYGAGLLLVVGFCGLAAYMLAELRQDTQMTAVRTSDNLLTAVVDDIERTINLYDLSLQAVIDGLDLPGIQDLPSTMRHAVLFDRAATAQYLGPIIVLDAEGRITEDSGRSIPPAGSFGDREYFKLHKGGFDGLYVSKPFRRLVSEPFDMVISVSRALHRPDGSFGGVVVGTLGLDYFKDLFARFKVGRQGVLTLVRKDGTVLVRWPYNESLIGRDVSTSENFRRSLVSSTGHFTGNAVVDGVRRLYSFRHVGTLPMVLNIGLGEAEVLSGWWRRAMVIGGVLLVLCLGAAGLAALFTREMRRRVRAELGLRESEAQYRLLAAHSTDVIIRLDHDLVRRYVSPASLSVLGYAPGELEGLKLELFVHPQDWPEVVAVLRMVQESEGTGGVSYRFRHRDGRWVWVEASYSYMPCDGGLAVVLRDVTVRKAAEQQLEAANTELLRLAVTDKLTGLFNRRGFDDALRGSWRSAMRDGTPLSLVLLDVDRFKLFNDRYGHVSGDECLRQLGRVIGEAAQRQGDVAARYGGEELALLFPNADEESAVRLAEMVRAGVARLAIPHAGNPEGGDIVTVSLGVASITPQHGQALASMSDLISAADAALYHAKRSGRNRTAGASLVAAGPDEVGILEMQAPHGDRRG